MTEKELQKNIVLLLDYFKKEGIIIDFFYIPNDIFFNLNKEKSSIYMNLLKKMGYRSGVSDLCIICKKKIFFLELKVGNNKQTTNQLLFQEKVKESLACEYVLLNGYNKEFLFNLFTKNEDK